jgi:Ca2+-binding RTX toxin-like protein
MRGASSGSHCRLDIRVPASAGAAQSRVAQNALPSGEGSGAPSAIRSQEVIPQEKRQGDVLAVKTARTASIVLAAATALGGSSYAATLGVQQALRSNSRASVAPPSIYRGTSGSDALRGSAGADDLIGEAGNDQLRGSAGVDSLLGGVGEDHLYGGDGDDVLEGDAGIDFMAGGRGHDNMSGGPGNDVFFGSDGCRDMIDGGPGSDIAVVDQFDVVRKVEHVLHTSRVASTCSSIRTPLALGGRGAFASL